MEDGKRRYGSDFHLIGSTDEVYKDPTGTPHKTVDVLHLGHSTDPYRGCAYAGPGHTWDDGDARPTLVRSHLAIQV